jgi:hypothetical protein
MAYGSPAGENGANNYAWAKTSNTSKTFAGCQVNTSTGAFDNVNGAKPFAISGKNIVDCGGNVDKWISNESLDGTGTWGWQNVLGAEQGYAYLSSATGLKVFRCGGTFSDGVHAGQRTITGTYSPWSATTSHGIHFCCDSL